MRISLQSWDDRMDAICWWGSTIHQKYQKIQWYQFRECRVLCSCWHSRQRVISMHELRSTANIRDGYHTNQTRNQPILEGFPKDLGIHSSTCFFWHPLPSQSNDEPEYEFATREYWLATRQLHLMSEVQSKLQLKGHKIKPRKNKNREKPNKLHF